MTSLITAMEEHIVHLEMEMKEEVRERERERERESEVRRNSPWAKSN